MDQPAIGSATTIAPPRPWGFIGTLLWGVAGVTAWFLAQLVVFIGFVVSQYNGDINSIPAETLLTNGLLLSLATIIAAPAWVGVCWLAAKIRRWRAREYFALHLPTRGQLVFGVACLAVLLIAFDGMNWILGRALVPSFMVDAYRSSRQDGTVALLFLAVVVAAPVCEEIAFRGFLFRGFSQSWLGVTGTLLLTSAAWAGMHVQYDALVMGLIFAIGLLFGWLRWASGSTGLTIILHMLTNFVATLQTAIKVEWSL